MQSNKLLLPALLLISLLFIPAISHADQPKTILAIYMIGSDLEYDPNLTDADNAAIKLGATKDIKEMVSGWGDGSSDLGVIAGYGGSQKTGWEGLTVATIDDLKNDLEDGVIGNSNDTNLQGWVSCNMASADGMINFLKAVRAIYPQGRLILILWNHGQAWEGLGPDTNYPDSMMTPVDVRDAFRSTDQKIDLLGLDACFMANIEFLRVISPYVHYAVASEDTEPEHGWDYSNLISIIRDNPEISMEELGKKMVDFYLDNPDHQKGALSLSLLDLSHMQDLLTSFDGLVSLLADPSSDSGSYSETSRLIGNLSAIGAGKDAEGNDVAIMVDLMAFAEGAGKQIPAVKEESDACMAALKNFIIYSRSDSSVTQIHGVGIFSPVMASHPFYYQRLESGTVLDITNSWMWFITRLAEQIHGDSIPPELVSEGDGYRIIEDGYIFATDVFYQIRSDGSKIVLAEEPSLMSGDQHVAKPEWGGTGAFLTDNNSSSLLPAYYVETNDRGVQLYYSWGILIHGGEKNFIRMDLWFNPESGALQSVLRPYSINGFGEQVFGRSVTEPEPGDIFIMYSLVISQDGKTNFKEIGRVTWSEEMKVKTMKMPCGEYGLQVTATDLAGNTGITDIIPYSIPCNAGI